MDYHRMPTSYKSHKTNSNSISVSPFGKNISNTYHSSSSNNNNNYIYNNKITSSIDNEEENNDDYKYELLLKEKNTIIQKLQNQIKKLIFKEEEIDKKIKMQKHIIESLKESNKNLQEELSKKNSIIQQNQNIEKKIFHLQKQYLEESNNSYNDNNNNFKYIQSIKECMNKLNEKENEINTYKKRINILKINLQKKENELIRKNKILSQFQRNKSGSPPKNSKKNNNIFYERTSLSTKKAKSMKNYSNENSNNNLKLKEDLRQINIRTNKPNLYENNNNSNYNYNKLLESLNDIKTKYNYYYKLAHHLKSKNNKFIKEIQKLRSNLNVLNTANINLKKILNRSKSQVTQNNINKKQNLTNNINNIKLQSNNDLISDDEKDNNDINTNFNNNNVNSFPISDNMAVKKLYEALEKYRELYNQKEKECEDKAKTIESLNSLHNQITEYLTIIDELETTNKNNEDIINKLKERIKTLEKSFNDEKKRNELLIKKNDKLISDNKDKENKIKKLLEELKDKEILIKEEQINSLIKINSAELKQEKKEDFNKKINELQSFITKIKKELVTNKSEINKLTEENIFFKKKIKEKNEELEEKNITIEEIIKKLNDQEIQYKGVKYDNQELIQNAKQRLNDMKQKELKINQLLIENENIKKNNQILINNKQIFIEEKNKLISNYNLLAEELKSKKENIEYLQSILIQKTELIDKLQKSNNELIIELSNTKNELKQKKIELNQFEVQYNKLKQEKNISKELINLVEENKNIILQNETLQNELDKLNQENNDINIQLNEMNKKYQEQKKIIQEKDKELTNMKEASKAILEKHKKIMEEKTQKYDPNFWNLISTKKYNKLTWYLLQKKFEQKSINYNTNIYDKFIWVNGDTITKNELSKFNQIEEDDQKIIKDLQDFNYNLQKKLERKEESINILDYKNKKLMEQIQNKTFANTGNNKLKFNLGKNDNTIKNNINGSMGERGFESEKFKNILQQLNNSNLRETKLQNEVKNLKEKLKKKEEFEAGFPKHFKDIEPSGNDSGFLDDDLREQEKKCIFDLVKSDDRDKLSTKKSDTNNYNENNEDNRKLREEIIVVKNRNKELEIKYKNLEDMVKDLIKNVKYENNIKPHIVQICQILGYSPQTTQKIVKNKISGLKNFELK